MGTDLAALGLNPGRGLNRQRAPGCQSARLKNLSSTGLAQIRSNTASGSSKYRGTTRLPAGVGLVSTSLVVNQNSGDGFPETMGCRAAWRRLWAHCMFVLSM